MARFHDPPCHEKIQVPPGSVAAFKNNSYIDPACLEKEKPFCKNHRDSREIELYRLQCDASICLKCKITDHSHHNIEDV